MVGFQLSHCYRHFLFRTIIYTTILTRTGEPTVTGSSAVNGNYIAKLTSTVSVTSTELWI